MSPWPSKAGWAALRLRWQHRLRPPAPWQLYRAGGGWWAQAPGAAQGQTCARLDDWAAAHPGHSAWLWLEAAQLQHLPLPAELPLEGPALLDYARLQFGQYFGAEASHWPLASWTQAGQRHVWALRDTALPAQLTQLARRHGLRWLGLRPAWAGGLARCAQQPGWADRPAQALAVLEGEQLSWLRFEHGALCAMQQRRVENTESATPMAELPPDLLDAATPVQWLGWGARPELAAEPAAVAGWGLP